MVSPVARIGRRKFIGWAAAGVVTGGVVVAAVRTSGYDVAPDVADKLRVFSAWQYAVMSAFARRVLAPEPVEVAGFIDGYLVGLPDPERRDLLRFVAYVEHVAPLATGRLRRFTSLDAEAQDAVLASLEASGIDLLRAGFQALKALSMMAYYRLPESWPALGYGGPVVAWEPR
jgi:hypothetical protein